MAHDFKHSHNDSSSWIAQYEAMLHGKQPYFFEVEAYEAIIEHYSNLGKWDDALQACEVGIEQHPFSSDLLLSKADLLARRGLYEAALELIERVLSLHPSETDAILLKSNILSIQGEYQKAVDCLHTATSWAYQDADLWFQLAWTYQHWGKPEQAIELYEKVIRLDYTHDLAHFEYAHCLEFTNCFERGIDFYEQLIDQAPYNAHAWFYLGDLYFQMNEYDKAIHAFEYTTLIDEYFAQAYFKLGSAYMNLEQYGKARQYLEMALDKEESPSAELYCYIAATYEKEANYSHAIQMYRQALRADDACDDAWYGIGCCLEAMGRHLEAIHYYEKACKFDPLNGMYHYRLAHAEYVGGYLISALQHYAYAAELIPFYNYCWLDWSFAYYEQGDYARAIDTLLEGLNVNPDEPSLLYRMVAYLLRAGRFQESMQYLETALLIDFDAHTTLYEFFDDLQTQKVIFRMVEHYRPR